jgi:hypothetical protein
VIWSRAAWANAFAETGKSAGDHPARHWMGLPIGRKPRLRVATVTVARSRPSEHGAGPWLRNQRISYNPPPLRHQPSEAQRVSFKHLTPSPSISR